MNSSDLNEIRLLNKKDFLIDIIKPQYKEKYKNWKIKDLREYFELTHKKHGKDPMWKIGHIVDNKKLKCLINVAEMEAKNSLQL